MLAGCNKYCIFIGQTTSTAKPIKTPSNYSSFYGKYNKHDNLTKAQRTLLRLHHRYGHRIMFDIRQ